jgi:hypothetical protein
LHVRSGNFEVFWSGVVIHAKSAPLDFVFDDGFFIRCLFEQTNTRVLEVNFEPKNEQWSQLTFVNFDSDLGVITREPVEVGTVKGKKLFLLLDAVGERGLANPQKLITYTFLLG